MELILDNSEITKELFDKVVGFSYGKHLAFNFTVNEEFITWTEEDYEDVYFRKMPISVFNMRYSNYLRKDIK